jgi:hypothetical protein
MFTDKRNVLALAGVLATTVMAGGVTAVEFAVHPSQPGPAIVHAAPVASPVLQQAEPGEQS